MRALLILLAVCGTASADLGRDMCTSNTRYRGAVRDLDVKAADIRDVFRLLADTGNANIVVADDVSGRVTMRLKRVPWDQILCTVAAMNKLRVRVDRGVIMVTKQ